jgi:hypothetical protein
MANPSVEEKIKAAAAAKGIPADLALRIAGAESSYTTNAKNPRSTAGGLFQVIDDTWKRYGGAPGKKYDVDENIRVGTDIIADNMGRMRKVLNREPSYSEVYAAHFFGPTGAKAVINAAPDTPSNKVFSAKVLGDNPNLQNKTTADIMTMLDRKMNPRAKSFPPAAEFSAPGRPNPMLLTQNTQTLPNVSRETMLAALGPNYQAAMALSYLSSNTDEDDSDLDAAKARIAADKESARSPGMEFLMEERRPSPFASLDLTTSTPFAEPVARMADGGAVHRADGSPSTGETSYFQDPMGVADSGPVTSDTKTAMTNGVVPTARQMLDTAKEIGSGTVRNIKNTAKGVTELPYDLLGGPVDLTTAVMRLAGYDQKTPIFGSDWLKEKATEAGIRQAPPTDSRDRGFYTLGEIGSGFINPSAPVLGTMKAVNQATTAGKEAIAAGKAAISATGEKMGKAVLSKMEKLVEAKRQRLIEKAATRPLTPRETRSLRLIEADMQDPTGMYRVSRNPGLLEQVIAEQNIARLHGPAAPAVPEIAPVAPPVDVRVPAAAQEALPPPPAEVNIPAEMLAPANQAPQGWGVVNTSVAPPDLVSVGQPANAPFVGRLDTFIQSLKGPVTLGQLKGQLKGKFRDYDLARVDEAFKGMDPNTKLKPAQIVSALENTYSPSKWVSQTLPPEQGKYWGGMDTVWDQPLGTTNLYLAQAPEKIAAHQQALEITNNLIPFATSSAVMPSITNLENTRNILKSDLVKNNVNPAHVNELLIKLDKVEPRVQELSKKQELTENLKYGVMYPSIYNDAEFIAKIKASDPSANYISTPHSYFLHKKIAELKAQGVTDFDQRWDTAFNYASKEVHNLVSNKMEAAGLGRPDFSGIDYANSQKMSSQPVAINLMDTIVEPLLQQNRMDLNAIKKYTGDSTKKVAADLEKARLYEGKHKSVAGEPYPIGFTRFSEHEANIGGQTLQGRHFHEIQSDLSKDVKRQGSSSGSKAADQTEYDGLQEKLNQIKTSMKDALTKAEDARQAGQDAAPYRATAETIGKSLPALESRVRTLDNRMRNPSASYALQEPFAGFETNSNVRSQLLMKNAIYSAMKDGKNFATFPGEESAQAQLYVGKVMPNLKQIAKDLGGDKAGISVTPIQLPPATKGNAPGVPVTAWGITWSPEAAARITKTGMPFAKGGMVERQPDDNRRYL